LHNEHQGTYCLYENFLWHTSPGKKSLELPSDLPALKHFTHGVLFSKWIANTTAVSRTLPWRNPECKDSRRQNHGQPPPPCIMGPSHSWKPFWFVFFLSPFALTLPSILASKRERFLESGLDESWVTNSVICSWAGKQTTWVQILALIYQQSNPGQVNWSSLGFRTSLQGFSAESKWKVLEIGQQRVRAQ
jgi:hypothetical protein